jgi:DNA (cytosine-5)-methyltransferase 1
MSSKSPAFRFVDLFAGIGGFHAALSALGGECVYASEIDEAAAKIYQHNWGLVPDGDIIPATTERMDVPEHDVLAAGFPCQPFSKSGFQRGMDEARGTLFWNICRVLEERRPSLVILENVRNIAGPRHRHEWEVIIRSLRELGYQVSSTPTVFSPHLLPPWLGGRPQVRERVFIVGSYVGTEQSHIDVEPVVTNRPVSGWNPQDWVLGDYLQDEDEIIDRANYELTATEQHWVHVWSDFVRRMRGIGVSKLPGFPIWVDAFVHEEDLWIEPDTPRWKANFLRRNAEFYTAYQSTIDAWLRNFGALADLPASRRKFEWQAQDAESLSECIMHFRPSGIRAKRPTYVPALVAITQTTILGDPLRRITPREAARLQSLPESFEFPGQPDAISYKQLGNGVNAGAVYHVCREQMARSDARWQETARHLPDSLDAVV